MNTLFQKTNQTLFMKTNVRNITFDGIDSPLLTIFEGTIMEGTIQMPFDKFGWFYDVSMSVKRSQQNAYLSHLASLLSFDDCLLLLNKFKTLNKI